MKKKSRSKKPVRKTKPIAAKVKKKTKPKSRRRKVTLKARKKTAPRSKKTGAKKKKTTKVKQGNKKTSRRTFVSANHASKIRKKLNHIPRLTPQENLERPFSIVESYMGTYDFKDIYSILFVCTGNMCRSPIAEGLLQNRIKTDGSPWADKILVQSCGTYAMEGNKPSQYAVQVARQHGIDVSGIRSKSLNRVFIEQSDLILVMSIDHLNYILENFPTARHKTFLLKLFHKNRPISLSDSIPDPMGFSVEFYQKTFYEIRSAIDESYGPLMERVHRKLTATDGKR